MENEIKEIIDKLKDGNWYEELDLTGTMWIELRWEETHLLLDYITNLQEENERLTISVVSYDETLLKRNNEYEDYKSRCEKAIEYLEYQISQLDFEKDTKAKMLGAMVLVLLQGSDNNE